MIGPKDPEAEELFAERVLGLQCPREQAQPACLSSLARGDTHSDVAAALQGEVNTEDREEEDQVFGPGGGGAVRTRAVERLCDRGRP